MSYVKKIIIHPKYDDSQTSPNRFDYDIAILQLENSLNLKLKNAKSICLPEINDDPKEETTLTVTGWGVQSMGNQSKNISDLEHLMAADVNVVERTKCDNLVKDYLIKHFGSVQNISITENMICAGNGTKDSCKVRMKMNELKINNKLLL